jgi:hypothetical protein
LCQCDCGNTITVPEHGLFLKNGHATRSCGCTSGRKPIEKGRAAFNSLYCLYRGVANRRGFEFLLTLDQALLFMRKNGDYRKDAIIKKEIFDNNIRGKFNIDFALDDRNQCCEMWRSLGLTCLQVANGDF